MSRLPPSPSSAPITHMVPMSAPGRRLRPETRQVPSPGRAGGTATSAETSKQGDTPSLLAALRMERGATAKIDTAAYHCIRDIATLKAWVAEALEAGIASFDVRATSADPMQAELIPAWQ